MGTQDTRKHSIGHRLVSVLFGPPKGVDRLPARSEVAPLLNGMEKEVKAFKSEPKVAGPLLSGVMTTGDKVARMTRRDRGSPFPGLRR